MAKKAEKIKVKVAEVWPGRIVLTADKKTVRIPHNVEHPEVGDELEIGSDWIGDFKNPKPAIEEAKKEAADDKK